MHIWIYTEISSCNDEYTGEPLALDKQTAFITKDDAQKALEAGYKQKLSYEDCGEIIDHYCEDDMYEVILCEDGPATVYQGHIRELEV